MFGSLAVPATWMPPWPLPAMMLCVLAVEPMRLFAALRSAKIPTPPLPITCVPVASRPMMLPMIWLVAAPRVRLIPLPD